MAVINFMAISDTFIVVYDNISYWKCIFVMSGSYTTTGQPFMQEFSSFADAQAIFGTKITDPTMLG